jgi:hypothetical protein
VRCRAKTIPTVPSNVKKRRLQQVTS